MMVCKIDEIEVEPVDEPKRVIGRGGYRITWKHKSLHDEGGNPYCGKTLTDDDVEERPDAT